MESRVIQDITGQLYDMYVVWHLNNLQKQYANILEVTYLPDFVDVETLNNVINPKYIIRDMLITYLRSVYDIYKQPSLLQELIFTFHDENGAIRKFEFSNNMMFSDDITTICFLYNIIDHPHIYQCATVLLLLSLMKNKYGISIEISNMDNTKFTHEQNKITLYDIGFSYPSIMWGAVIDLGLYNDIFNEIFSVYGLPKNRFVSLFLLPSHDSFFLILNKKSAFAIYMVAALQSIKIKIPEAYNVILLRTLFYEISALTKRQIFPEHLKLELWTKWQFVVMENDTYKYAPCFAAFCQKAKDVLAMVKPSDPDLDFVLSQL